MGRHDRRIGDGPYGHAVGDELFQVADAVADQTAGEILGRQNLVSGQKFDEFLRAPLHPAAAVGLKEAEGLPLKRGGVLGQERAHRRRHRPEPVGGADEDHFELREVEPFDLLDRTELLAVALGLRFFAAGVEVAAVRLFRLDLEELGIRLVRDGLRREAGVAVLAPRKIDDRDLALGDGLRRRRSGLGKRQQRREHQRAIQKIPSVHCPIPPDGYFCGMTNKFYLIY